MGLKFFFIMAFWSVS